MITLRPRCECGSQVWSPRSRQCRRAARSKGAFVDDNPSLTVQRGEFNTWNVSGSGKRWFVTDADKGAVSEHGSWQEAVKSAPDLHRLTPGPPTNYRLSGTAITADELLELLTFDGDPVDGAWPDEAVGTVDGVSIYFFPKQDDGSLVAVLGDDYSVVGVSRASFSWSDDMFPMSTTYSNELVELSRGRFAVLPTGDLREQSVDPEVRSCGPDPASRAVLVEDWLNDMAGAPVAAVFALEPLDPDALLAAEERERWEEALDDDRYSISIDLDDETATALRQSLAQGDPSYAFIRDALCAPKSPEGELLYAELIEGDILVAAIPLKPESED